MTNVRDHLVVTSAHRAPHPVHRSAPPVLPDVVGGLLVAVLGAVEILSYSAGVDTRFLANVAVVLGSAVACGLSRRAPGLALLALLATGLFQVVTGADLLLTQLALLVVAYGTSRHGSTLVLWLSGIALPFAPVFAFSYLATGSIPSLSDALRILLSPRSGQLVGPALIGFGSLAFFLLPWFLGLVLRGRESTRRSQEEERAALRARDRARDEEARATEIARLRSGQARLARDVHDVVGHSLAVILAQAESAQYLADDDPEATKRALANVAGSARQSLRDVRAVLGATGTPADASAPVHTGALPAGSLQTLIDDVRSTGVQVEDLESGTPRDLTVEHHTVAFRALQEMLTNALRHGRRDRPVGIRRDWPDGSAGVPRLSITVTNLVAPDAERVPGGRGIEGLRHRLDAVGGRLAVHTAPAQDDGTAFTATASLPLG